MAVVLLKLIAIPYYFYEETADERRGGLAGEYAVNRGIDRTISVPR